MNTKRKSTGAVGAVIAAICILIYLFALVQATVRIYFSIEKCRVTAEQEFSRIAGLALSAGIQGFMDDRFISTMNNALASSTMLEALIISGPGGEYAFERQQGYAVTWANNSPRFKNRLGFSNQDYYRPLPIHDLYHTNFRAVAGAFDYSEISQILKETLFLILIGFAVSFFTMLLQLLTGKPAASYERTSEAPVREKTAMRTSHQAAAAQQSTEAPIILEAHPSLEKGPKGLYSPRSNIGWEEYTNDRLDSEIHRCASTEKDLTIALIEFADLKNDFMFKQAAEEAVSFYSSRDLLFEHGEQAILAILPGVDLDTGITKSEKFYQRIIGKFPNSNTSSSSISIGLTSRSGRLVNADRMMKEVMEALSKARKDPKSSIIAFKSDPEKYRAFIASQN